MAMLNDLKAQRRDPKETWPELRALAEEAGRDTTIFANDEVLAGGIILSIAEVLTLSKGPAEAIRIGGTTVQFMLAAVRADERRRLALEAKGKAIAEGMMGGPANGHD